MQDKICTKCKICKPLSDFRKDKTKSSGRYSSCKNCSSKVLTKNQSEIFELKKSISFYPIPGYESIYSISKCGMILSDRKFKIKETHHSQSGYESLMLWVNNKYVHHSIHRLLALTFIPNPENKPQVNHIDGNKLNNHLDNLEWVTASENGMHAYMVGLSRSVRNKPVINDKGDKFESATAAAKSIGKHMQSVICAIKQKSRRGGTYWNYI